MIDIFANGKPDEGMDWEDDPFATDYLMQADNKFEMVGRDHVIDPFAGPEGRRRKKSRAPRLFTHMDALLDHGGDPGRKNKGAAYLYAAATPLVAVGCADAESPNEI